MVVNDCGELSRGRLDLAAFLHAYCYHRPNEGELENLSWREDPAPVHELVKQYTGRHDAQSPSAQRTRLAAETAAAKVELVRNLAPSARPAGTVEHLAWAHGDPGRETLTPTTSRAVNFHVRPGWVRCAP
jgi:hypothetical protein